jgi:hypothetical protein
MFSFFKMTIIIFASCGVVSIGWNQVCPVLGTEQMLNEWDFSWCIGWNQGQPPSHWGTLFLLGLASPLLAHESCFVPIREEEEVLFLVGVSGNVQAGKWSHPHLPNGSSCFGICLEDGVCPYLLSPGQTLREAGSESRALRYLPQVKIEQKSKSQCLTFLQCMCLLVVEHCHFLGLLWGKNFLLPCYDFLTPNSKGLK